MTYHIKDTVICPFEEIESYTLTSQTKQSVSLLYNFDKWSVTHHWQDSSAWCLSGVFCFSFLASAHESEDDFPVTTVHVSCGECCWTQLPVSFWLVMKRTPQGTGCVQQWDTAVCVCVWEGDSVCRQDQNISNCTAFSLICFHTIALSACCGFQLWHPWLLHSSYQPQESSETQLQSTDFSALH